MNQGLGKNKDVGGYAQVKILSTKLLAGRPGTFHIYYFDSFLYGITSFPLSHLLNQLYLIQPLQVKTRQRRYVLVIR